MNLLIKLFLVLIVISLSIFLFTKVVDEDSALINEVVVADGDDEREDDDEEEKLSIIDGFKAIKVDEQVIDVSGLAFEALQVVSFKPEFIAYAEVVDTTILVLSKTEYLNLVAKQKVLQKDLYNHNKILERVKALHNVKSVSTRELEKNRAARDLKYSELNAINTRIESYIYKLKASWGEKLSSLVLNEENKNEFDLLTTNQKKLLLVSLPKNKSLSERQQNVFVNHLNKRGSAKEASYFDFAKQVNNPIYGPSYYYFFESEDIRVGMRLFAWVSEGSKPIEGHFIHDKAVVWYANEPWVYVKHKEEIFIRKPLRAARKINDGWLLEDTMFIGDDFVVTKGGQTLLSEEFKWAIPDEDND